MQDLKRIYLKYENLYEEQSREFSKYGVDFYSTYKNGIEDCTDCEIIFRSSFMDIISKLDIDKSWNFLDCGCGLGLTLYLSHELFNKVYGIEILEKVAEIANSNLQKMKVENYEVVNEDIRKISEDLIDRINVFYLFNPFVGEVFDVFLKNLEASILRKDREVYVIYANCICEDKFVKYENILPLETSVDDFKKINYYHHKKEV